MDVDLGDGAKRESTIPAVWSLFLRVPHLNSGTSAGTSGWEHNMC